MGMDIGREGAGMTTAPKCLPLRQKSFEIGKVKLQNIFKI